jgi:hypothetical protein
MSRRPHFSTALAISAAGVLVGDVGFYEMRIPAVRPQSQKRALGLALIAA